MPKTRIAFRLIGHGQLNAGANQVLVHSSSSAVLNFSQDPSTPGVIQAKIELEICDPWGVHVATNFVGNQAVYQNFGKINLEVDAVTGAPEIQYQLIHDPFQNFGLIIRDKIANQNYKFWLPGQNLGVATLAQFQQRQYMVEIDSPICKIPQGNLFRGPKADPSVTF